jgi:hypothetical protein
MALNARSLGHAETPIVVETMRSIGFIDPRPTAGLLLRLVRAAPIVRVECPSCERSTFVDLRVALLTRGQCVSGHQIRQLLVCGRCASPEVHVRQAISL